MEEGVRRATGVKWVCLEGKVTRERRERLALRDRQAWPVLRESLDLLDQWE